jgi:hypothetical protein
MAIYDKYTGQPWQSTSSPLIMATDSGTHSFAFTNNSLLEDLKNNEEAYIVPKYLRDMIISTWDSIAFKETTASGSSISYIGIDSGEADDLNVKPNRDLEVNKILIGKRSFTGTQSYTASADIMTSSLIQSDVDVYFYNTKRDIDSQQRTRIRMLSGTNPSLHQTGPYLQSQVVTVPGGSHSTTMDIVAPNGSIYILSRGKDIFGNDVQSGGTVSVNNITFPTFASSSNVSGGLDSKNLIYRDGELSWETIEFPQTDHIGITGSLLTITGDPVNLNGISLEFTDSRYVTAQIGDIQLGSTFDSMSIADAIRKIVYPYLPPMCTLSLSSGQRQYLEVGTYPNISLSYTITKRSSSTKPTKLINMIPSTYPAITDPGQIVISGTARGVVITPLMATSSIFTVKASDGSGFTLATASISGIYPYFYGFTSSNTLTLPALSFMSKAVEPIGDKVYDFVGSGNLFFAYDYDYGPLSQILDPDNNNIIGSFSAYVKVLSSPTGLWASKQYRVYQLNGVPQVGPPSENYEFIY